MQKQSGAWSLVSQLSTQGIMFLTFLITARFLEKETFGIIAICLIFTELAKHALSESIATYLVSRQTLSPDDLGRYFSATVVLGLISTGLLIGLSFFIDYIFAIEGIGNALCLMSFAVLLHASSKMNEVLLIRKSNFRTLALKGIFCNGTAGIVSAYLAFRGYEVTALVTQYLIIAFLSAIYLWCFAYWKPKINCKISEIIETIKSMKYMFFSDFIVFIGNQSRIIFLSSYVGVTAVGVYNTAQRILLAFQMVLSGSVLSILRPSLSRNIKNPSDVIEKYLNASSLASIVIVPCYAILYNCSYPLTILLLGHKWADAADIIQIISISGFMHPLIQINLNILLVKDKPNIRFNILLIGFVTSMVIAFLSAPYGLTAIAWSEVLILLIALIVSLKYCCKIVDVRLKSYIRTIAPALSSGAISVLATYFLSEIFIIDHIFLDIIFKGSISLGLYATALILISKNDILKLKKLFLVLHKGDL
ncbi:MAG: oligosaccharide flippase family protein [Pseudomonadota bacterium]